MPMKSVNVNGACILPPSFAFVQGGGWGVVHSRLKFVRFCQMAAFSTRFSTRQNSYLRTVNSYVSELL